MYGYWVSLSYTDGMTRSIIRGLESNTYDTSDFESTFGRKTLEVEVDFTEKQSEIDLLKMEREFGFGDDTNDTDVTVVQQRVVIKMADVRTLKLFKGG